MLVNRKKKKYTQAASLAILLVAVAVLPQFISNEYAFQYLSMVLLYAYWAVSWNIIGGFAGQEALGHSVYIGIGAYVSVLMTNQLGLSVWIGCLVGGLAAGIMSALISYPVFRLKGVYFTLSTVALQMVICSIMVSENRILGIETNGAEGIRVPWTGGGLATLQFMSKIGYFYVFLAALIAVLAVSWLIKRSDTGYYLSAISTDEDAARALGVNVTYNKLKAMFISAFFTAVGGAFYAQFVLFIDPARVFGFDLSAELVILSVIGGKGLIFGPMVGAFIMVPIKEFLRASFGNSLSGLWAIVYGAALLLTIFFMPKGVMRAVEQLWKRRKTSGKKLPDAAALLGKKGE